MRKDFQQRINSNECWTDVIGYFAAYLHSFKFSLAYYLSLTLIFQTSDCPICTTISTRTHMFVPHLTARPTLPLFFSGEWISQTCEPRSMGLHTIRSYRFNQYTSEWESETKYYSNYACFNLLMIHNAVGHYHQGSTSGTVSGATEMDFHIEKSYLTIADQSILDDIETDLDCGIAYYWKVHKFHLNYNL